MPGHLEKRSRDTWTIVIDVGRDPSSGKRKRIYRAFRGTKKAAEIEMARLLTELEQGLFVEPVKLTLGEYLKKWLNDYAKISVAPKTFLRYQEIILKCMLPELGQIAVEKLKPLHLQNYYAKMLESGRQDGKGGLSPTTVLQHHRILHRALEMAVKWQVIARNVADAVEPPKKTKHKITPLDESQVFQLIKAAETTPFFSQVVLAVFTGMRRGEIYGLRWPNIDFVSGTISIKQAAQYTKEKGIFFKVPKSEKSIRTIDVSPYVLEVLKKEKVKQNKARLAAGENYKNPEDLVFTQQDGQPQHPDSLSSWFPEFMVKNGLPRIRFHDLRHYEKQMIMGIVA